MYKVFILLICRTKISSKRFMLLDPRLRGYDTATVEIPLQGGKSIPCPLGADSLFNLISKICGQKGIV